MLPPRGQNTPQKIFSALRATKNTPKPGPGEVVPHPQKSARCAPAWSPNAVHRRGPPRCETGVCPPRCGIGVRPPRRTIGVGPPGCGRGWPPPGCEWWWAHGADARLRTCARADHAPLRGASRRCAARARETHFLGFYLKRHFNRSKREWVRQQWRGWEVQRPKLPKAASPAHLRDSGASAAFDDPFSGAIPAVKNSKKRSVCPPPPERKNIRGGDTLCLGPTL